MDHSATGCSGGAGFPLVFTRILTLHQPPTAQHYGLLLLYNLAQATPLAVIVVMFTATLGTRKLTAQQGGVLKLLSGTLMLPLGALLLLGPQHLSEPLVATGLLLTSVVVVAASESWQRRA